MIIKPITPEPLYTHIDSKPVNAVLMHELAGFHAWLRQDYEIVLEGNTKEIIPTWYRICYLVTCNNGWEMRGWGTLSYGPTGHQHGLTQEEAFELLYYFGYFTGIRDHARFDPFEILKDYYLEYKKSWQPKESANEV